MKIDILTLFPEMIDSAMGTSIIGRAIEKAIVEIKSHNIRQYTTSKQGRVDDYPYGGGKGMVMQCDPLYRCLQAVTEGEHVHTVLMSPHGTAFNQEKARELLSRGHIVIVCGHYEGIDRRFIDKYVDEEISIGDFVLTGGEIGAMAVSDAVCRMVPGVLAEEVCFSEESHFAGVLEYPQYTRPEVWQEMAVPDILLSGHHANIAKWRRQQSLQITRQLRPDMFDSLELTIEDKKLLK